jgi:hypothetical protein
MARLHSFYTSNARQELNYVGQNLSDEDFDQTMKDYTDSLIFDMDMFTEEVEEDTDDPFENLTPIEDFDDDDISAENDSDLLVSDLINLNSVIGEEIEPQEVDHGEKEFDIEDIISDAGYLGSN